MAWSDFLTGTPAQLEQIQRFNPQQQNILSMLLSQGMQGIQNPYQGFEPIAQQATNQFYQNTIPSLAERFTSMGQNSLSSPVFASQLGQAGADLSSNLAALQSQYGMQNRNQMMNLLNMGLTPQFESVVMPGQEGMLQQTLPALGKVGMHALGAGLTGGMSAIPSAFGGLMSMLAGMK